MCRCLKEGLVEGKNLAVDGTIIKADASQGSRVPRAQFKEAAQVAKTAAEYLTELEQDNPVSGSEMVSTTDPDAILLGRILHAEHERDRKLQANRIPQILDQRSVEVADLDDSGTRISNHKRLTTSEGNEYPMAGRPTARQSSSIPIVTVQWKSSSKL